MRLIEQKLKSQLLITWLVFRWVDQRNISVTLTKETIFSINLAQRACIVWQEERAALFRAL